MDIFWFFSCATKQIQRQNAEANCRIRARQLREASRLPKVSDALPGIQHSPMLPYTKSNLYSCKRNAEPTNCTKRSALSRICVFDFLISNVDDFLFLCFRPPRDLTTTTIKPNFAPICPIEWHFGFCFSSFSWCAFGLLAILQFHVDCCICWCCCFHLYRFGVRFVFHSHIHVYKSSSCEITNKRNFCAQSTQHRVCVCVRLDWLEIGHFHSIIQRDNHSEIVQYFSDPSTNNHLPDPNTYK